MNKIMVVYKYAIEIFYSEEDEGYIAVVPELPECCAFKSLDCVAMKRRIQGKIYRETRGKNAEELLEYFHRRVANVPFAHFFPELSEKTQIAEGTVIK